MSKRIVAYTLRTLSLLIVTISLEADSTRMIYPTARKETIAENFHGTQVTDPYRWLEDKNSEETKKWVRAQQELTENFLASCPAREKIKNRITHLWNYKKYSAPSKAGDYYFYWHNNGLQNQYVLYRAKNLTDEPILVIDPNKLSADGTVSIESTAITKDGSFIAYSISVHGSDWKEVKILNIETGKEYPETLKWCKHTSIAWKYDNSGFYYNRFLEHEGHEDGVYWHTLGTDQSQDQLIYRNNQQKDFVNAPCVTEDGNYLLISTSKGCGEKSTIAFRPINSQEPFTKIFDNFEAKYEFAGNVDSIFYFLTDNDAPRHCVIMVDVDKDVMARKIVISETKDTLSSASIINNLLVCDFMQDAHTSIRVYTLDGTLLNTIPLPTAGSASYAGTQEDPELFITFTSFLYPTTIFQYSFTDNTLTQTWDVGIDFNPDPYVTKQVFYQSKDGTTVPMFITHKKDLPLNGNNPTLLYGYGGFEVSMTPFFSVTVLNWLEQGGVFAVANIRGGGEYGATWHEAAMNKNRQKAFDDFIAAGEWLVANSYTKPSKLAINGGSNGGLLVAVCMQQRPDLFGAVVSQVPVTDMLRFNTVTAGHFWMPEYGDVSKADEFKAMYSYSPLHNVQDEKVYPPILVTSADTDDRVIPMHSKKLVARLQEASNGKNLILLRYETAAGHGAGKPTSKIIEEHADKYAFLFKVFGMEFKG